MGAVVAVFGLILLPFIFYFRRKSRGELEELLAGGEWARWTYERAEWERFLYDEWRTARKRNLKMALYLGAGGLAGGLLPALADGDLTFGLPIGILFALGGAGVPGLILLSARNHLHRSLPGQPEVLVGPYGAYICGRYLRWGNTGHRSVKLSPGAPSLLRFELHGKSSFDGPLTLLRIGAAKGAARAALQAVTSVLRNKHARGGITPRALHHLPARK